MKKTNRKRTVNELAKTDNLSILINEVNNLPFKYGFQPLDPEIKREGVGILYAAHKTSPTIGYGQNIVLNWVDEQRRRINYEINDLPKSFQKYIWKNDLSEAEIAEKLNKELSQFNYYPNFYQGFIKQLDLSEDAFNAWIEIMLTVLKYERFYRLREQFQYIMRLAYRAHNKIADTDFVQGLKQAYANKYANSLTYNINAQGVLTVMADEFSQAINGKKVSLIRECRKCQKIFWGKNTRSQYCDAECRKTSNTFHADKSRRKLESDPDYRKRKLIIKRRNTLAELKADFLNNEKLWSDEMILFREQKQYPLPKDTKVKIIKISFNDTVDTMPFKFDVESESGLSGYFEVEFDNKLESKLKKFFNMDVGWKRKRNNPRGATRKTKEDV